MLVLNLPTGLVIEWTVGVFADSLFLKWRTTQQKVLLSRQLNVGSLWSKVL